MSSEVPKGWSRPTQLSIYASNETRKWTGREALPYIGLEHLEQATGRVLGFGDSQSVTSAKNVFDPGDVLFGKLRPNLRKYWKADRRGICSTDILVLRSKLGLESDYLFAIVQSDPFLAFAEEDAAGTKMPRTSWSRLRTFELSIPPINEQQRIAEVLSSVDECIQATQAVIDQAERVKQGLMEELLTGGLGSAAIEQGEVPEGWQCLKLGSICSPKQHPTIAKTRFTDSGYPVFGANGRIGYYSEYTHAERTIAVTCRGATCGTVNVVPAFSYITGNAMALDRLKTDVVDFDYISHYLSFFDVHKCITGSAQPQITRSSLLPLEITIPPLNHQKLMAASVSSFEQNINAHYATIEQYKRVKQGLMDDLLTGKVRTV